MRIFDPHSYEPLINQARMPHGGFTGFVPILSPVEHCEYWEVEHRTFSQICSTMARLRPVCNQLFCPVVWEQSVLHQFRTTVMLSAKD